MASQMYGVTGDRRLKRRNQVAAMNARLPYLADIMNRQREDQRFEYQKKVDAQGLALQKRGVEQAHDLKMRELDQKKKAERANMGLQGLNMALGIAGDSTGPLFDGGGEAEGMKSLQPTALPSQRVSPWQPRQGSGFDASSANIGRWQPRQQSGLSGSMTPTNQGPMASMKGHMAGIKGGLTPSSTLGAGLAGFGAGSIFGSGGKNKWKDMAIGAGAGMLMNFFGGGGSPGFYDDILAGVSGGLGGMFSGLF